MENILIAFFIPGGIIIIDFFIYLITGKHIVGEVSSKIIEIIVMVGLPYLFLAFMDIGKINDCCDGSAFFSPEHKLTMYFIILLCLAAYFFSSYRKKISPPIIEIAVNALLLTGIVLNIFIAIQEGSGLWIIGNVPVIILFILMLIKNHRLIINHITPKELDGTDFINRKLAFILLLHPLLKMPILLVLCLPILIISGSILLLFGQKPDSFIRAFTDTYHHGLSQWNYMCDNVQCGGHYLCSVAAKGHTKIVKPKRLGIRGGNLIVCNRQLLVSNAFEELLEQQFPAFHKLIRRHYDRVGDLVHRYYRVFNIKWVSDVVYIIMKPLEWFFLIMLYTFDSRPENRIAQQYLNKADREKIRNHS